MFPRLPPLAVRRRATTPMPRSCASVVLHSFIRVLSLPPLVKMSMMLMAMVTASKDRSPLSLFLGACQVHHMRLSGRRHQIDGKRRYGYFSLVSEWVWEWAAASATRWLLVGHVECCGDGPLFFLGEGDSSLFFDGIVGITLHSGLPVAGPVRWRRRSE